MRWDREVSVGFCSTLSEVKQEMLQVAVFFFVSTRYIQSYKLIRSVLNEMAEGKYIDNTYITCNICIYISLL